MIDQLRNPPLSEEIELLYQQNPEQIEWLLIALSAGTIDGSVYVRYQHRESLRKCTYYSLPKDTQERAQYRPIAGCAYGAMNGLDTFAAQDAALAMRDKLNAYPTPLEKRCGPYTLDNTIGVLETPLEKRCEPYTLGPVSEDALALIEEIIEIRDRLIAQAQKEEQVST